ncbi:MAG: NAD-dependent epimerase/dehydratase family protein [Flavobacteriaceae bacterium]
MILVTGGTGLVGSHLLYYLCKQHDTVVAIHRKGSNQEAVRRVFSYYGDNTSLYEKIQWKEADITDVVSLADAFKGITHVYHCAALVSFDSADDAQMELTNIEGTANIVNLSITNKVKKICYVSSIATVGKSIQGKLIDENSEWNIEHSNYGYAITKHGAEMELWRASQEGVDVVIVNPGVILGSGFWRNGSGILVTSVHRGLKFYSEGITGFVGVEDVVKIMILLMESHIINERYILISENTSFKNVLFTIADLLDKKRPNIKITKTMSAIFWRIEWFLKLFGRTPLLTKQSASSAHNTYYFSNEKVKKELNYEFRPIKKVLEKICDDFKKDH